MLCMTIGFGHGFMFKATAMSSLAEPDSQSRLTPRDYAMSAGSTSQRLVVYSLYSKYLRSCQTLAWAAWPLDQRTA